MREAKELLAMSRVFSNTGSREMVIAAKGASEAIFDLCHIPLKFLHRYVEAVSEMAASGLRVSGVARGKIHTGFLPPIQHDFNFEFAGLIGISGRII